jgi:segregation and condensation protein B
VKKAQPTDESRENVEQAAAADESETLEEQAVEEASHEGERGEAVPEPQAVIDDEPQAAMEGEPQAVTDDEPQAEDDQPQPSRDAEPQAAENAAQPPLPHLLPSPDERRALLEAIVYVAEEPLSAGQIAEGLGLPAELVQADLEQLAVETQAATRGIEVRKVAGGYKMFTKAEHHDSIRQFVKTLRPKLRLSLPALETLAVIAYKQPVTVPEIQAIRGVNAGGVIHTLLNHKLITTAGRKKVIGRPMQYKTTKEFLVQFGLNDLSELPNLKELEELSRAALGEGEEPEPPVSAANHAGEDSAAGPESVEEDSRQEAGFADGFGDAADDSAAEQDLAASSPPTAVASAAAAGAGRVASPVSDDGSEDGRET